jgi:Predicted acyltransferase
MTLKVFKITTIAEFCDAVSIRLNVFEIEQGIPCEIEIDEYDKAADHFLITADGIPAGCARMIYKDHDTVKLGRIAVLKEYRKHGIGKALCDFMINEASAKGYKKAMLGAQIQAVGFYEKIGFQSYGDSYLEGGIDHVDMIKTLEVTDN